MDDRYLTTDEVGGLLRQPTSTIRYWRHNSYGPRSVKIGRRVLYRESDVRAWLASQYESQGGGAA